MGALSRLRTGGESCCSTWREFWGEESRKRERERQSMLAGLKKLNLFFENKTLSLSEPASSPPPTPPTATRPPSAPWPSTSAPLACSPEGTTRQSGSLRDRNRSLNILKKEANGFPSHAGPRRKRSPPRASQDQIRRMPSPRTSLGTWSAGPRRRPRRSRRQRGRRGRFGGGRRSSLRRRSSRRTEGAARAAAAE